MLPLWIYRSSRAQEALAENEESDFSLARYEPMARLMSQEDFLFLKAQPGFKPEIGRKFMRDRRRIFRMYLQDLASEFHRLHARARAIAASLPAENSALIGVLVRQKLQFWYEISAVELRLSFATIGMGSAVDARGLVDAIGRMHVEINRMAAPAAA